MIFVQNKKCYNGNPLSMISTEQESDEDIKSIPSRERSFVKFVNRTNTPVDIVWRGFRGEHIRYSSHLAPQGHFSVDTFVSHLWQAWNSHTLNILNIGGSPVFYPEKWKRERQRTVIYIDEPVHSLVRLCLEKIKSLVSVDDADSLAIPKLQSAELKKRRTVDIQDCIGLRRP